MRSRLLRAALVASALLVLLAMPAAAHEHLIVGDHAVVSDTDGDGVNVRSEPSLNSGVHFVAQEGTNVTVVSGPQEAGGLTWYGVNVDGTDAWIVGQFLSRAPSQAGGHVTVVGTNGHGLRLRSGASLESETLTVMPEGSTLDVVGDEQVRLVTLAHQPVEHLADRHRAVLPEDGHRGLQGSLSTGVAAHYPTSCRRAFWPVPNVDSVIVRIERATRPLHGDAAEFSRVVEACFSSRRKTVRNGLASLAGSTERAEEVLRAASISPSDRPEVLSPVQFAAIAQNLGRT
jgi:hypothetical protein